MGDPQLASYIRATPGTASAQFDGASLAAPDLFRAGLATRLASEKARVRGTQLATKRMHNHSLNQWLRFRQCEPLQSRSYRSWQPGATAQSSSPHPWNRPTSRVSQARRSSREVKRLKLRANRAPRQISAQSPQISSDSVCLTDIVTLP